MSPIRLTLMWTEQALRADQKRNLSAADFPDDYPFEGPALDADADVTAALERFGVLTRLDKLVHEGMSLQDTHEEGWFDLDQLDGLVAALEAMLTEVRQAIGVQGAAAVQSRHIERWLKEAIAFANEAKRLQRGVCFWL
jgi:hypothetical protein